MSSLSRAEIFDPSEIVAVHAIERTVRRCYLLGDDHLTQKNVDHRKKWFEDKLKQRTWRESPRVLSKRARSLKTRLVLRVRRT